MKVRIQVLANVGTDDWAAKTIEFEVAEGSALHRGSAAQNMPLDEALVESVLKRIENIKGEAMSGPPKSFIDEVLAAEKRTQNFVPRLPTPPQVEPRPYRTPTSPTTPSEPRVHPRNAMKLGSLPPGFTDEVLELDRLVEQVSPQQVQMNVPEAVGRGVVKAKSLQIAAAAANDPTND